MDTIPFNKPYLTGKENEYIAEAQQRGILMGDGHFTKECHAWLEAHHGARKALLAHSCTGALEMAAMLADIKEGDEIIMPSYTFVSTANAFALRGGVPVFVDIRPDTLNINEKLLEAAITPRTVAIAPVHYAGVACEMDSIMAIAKRHTLKVIEDAAQGVLSRYKGRSLGSIGDFGALSFHATKNVICGEGGALLVNDEKSALQAEIIREKGTDRSRYFRGEVDKYTWQTVGSSYLPSDMIAAFLWAQLQEAKSINARRMEIWERYNALCAPLEARGILRRPTVPQECEHNAHMYYILLADGIERQPVLDALKAHGIGAVFHYVPLHSAPAGQKLGRTHGSMEQTDKLSAQLIRLPLWVGLTAAQQEYIVSTLESAL